MKEKVSYYIAQRNKFFFIYNRILEMSIFLAFIVLILLPFRLESAPIAEGKSKFLGNVIGYNTPSTFPDYWNQVTSENAGKWGSCESSRDNMNLGTLQNHYNYAKDKGFVFKHHTLVWGSQEPGWIGGLSQNEQKQEVEEWIQAVANACPQADLVDVVNEPLHAPASYRQALGGEGSTGWDWVVWSFEKARQYFNNSKLLINEYGIVNDGGATDNYLQIINILKDKGLIDGIGVQSHCFNLDETDPSTIQSNLDKLAETGLPIYSSEMDIRDGDGDNSGNDNTQLERYQRIFPIFWEHSAVKGITLWGYVEGTMWKPTAYLLHSNGSERPALTWLREYVETGIASNKYPTDISLSSSDVDEDQPSGTEVGTFSTTDPDQDDSHTYSLVQGEGSDDNYSFSIEGNSLKTASVFDYNIKSSYRIRVETDDGNGGTYQETFTITVNEVSLPKYTLDITVEEYAGYVSISPQQNEYDSGTTVTLTANPNEGYDFTGWEGDLYGSDNPAQLVMDSDKDVTANFSMITKTLTHFLTETEQHHISGGVKSKCYGSIRFRLSSPQNISIDMLDTRGIKVVSLFNGFLSQGVHRINFPTQSLGKGLYLIVLKGENIKVCRKYMCMEIGD